jgi:hypothetical protein
VTSRLHDFIGTESKLEATSGALREFVEELGPAIVGAHHVTCSDETERECSEVFHRWFVGRILPDLKSAYRAAFRTINLGGRYEWGSARLAEDHFALAAATGGFKLLLVKINSHVAVRHDGPEPEYGKFVRYDRESTCCSALAAMLAGSEMPAARALANLFASDDQDRAETLMDPRRVPPHQRPLLAAVCNARLQSHRAVIDIAEHRPQAAAIFMVVPCVTINRLGQDTELVVGWYGIDWTGQAPQIKYQGLGDDPAAYRVRHEQRCVIVEDDNWPHSS